MKLQQYKDNKYICNYQPEGDEPLLATNISHHDRLEPVFGVQFDDGTPYFSGTVANVHNATGVILGDDTFPNDPEFELSFLLSSTIPPTSTITSLTVSFEVDNIGDTDLQYGYGLFDVSDGLDIDSGFTTTPSPAYTTNFVTIGGSASHLFSSSIVATVTPVDLLASDLAFVIGWNGSSMLRIKNLTVTAIYTLPEEIINSEYVHLDPCSVNELAQALDFCKDVPFASHIKYFPQLIQAIPAGYVAYAFANPIASTGFGTATDTNSLFIHAIYQTPGGIGVDVENTIIPFTGVSNGIIATNVIQIQNALNLLLVNTGWSNNDAIYTVTNSNEIAIWLSPVLQAAVGSTYTLVIYGSDSSTPSTYSKVDVDTMYTYTNTDIQLSPFESSSLCTPIQEIKYKNTCTGAETYKYVVEQGGFLVPVASVFPNFDEEQITESCPVFEKAGMVQFVGLTSVTIPSSGVISFTVTANAGAWDISFDGGTTWITGRKGSRTWGNTNITELVDTTLIQIRGNSAGSDIDVIYETIV